MKHFISFSGGRTSAYLVYLMEKKRINEGWDVNYFFIDTGAEHPRTYDFIRNVIKHFKINLVVLKPIVQKEMGKGMIYEIEEMGDRSWNLDTFRSMTQKYGNPFTPNGGFCTDRLKTVVYKKYLKSFGNVPITNWVGIRADEPKRLKPKKGIKYLADISDFDKEDILAWWAKQEFDLEIQEHLGNCVFCIKKTSGKIG